MNDKEHPSPEEMVALNLRRLAGDERAREEMILRNRALVYHIVRVHRGPKDPNFEDFVQEGIIGLGKAVDRFDHTRGAQFSTYAVWWIRQCVTRYARNTKRTIRIPIHVQETVNKIRRVAEHLAQELQRTPSVEEIAEECGIPYERIFDLFEKSSALTSLDAPISFEDSDDLTKYRSTPNPNAVLPSRLVGAIDEGMEAIRWINDLIARMETTFVDRDRLIFQSRYGLFGNTAERTLERTGDLFGITRERVRQICRKVFALRARLNLPISSEEEMKRALDCIQKAMEISFDLHGKVQENLAGVFNLNSSKRGDPDLPRKNDSSRTDRLFSKATLVGNLQALVQRIWPNPKEVRTITAILSLEDFNVPLKFSRQLLKVQDEKISLSQKKEELEKIRLHYSLALVGGKIHRAWEYQGKLFPGQKIEAAVLQKNLRKTLGKARRILGKDDVLPPEVKKAMLILYGIGQAQDESIETFAETAAIEEQKVQKAIDNAWQVLDNRYDLGIRSGKEYQYIEEEISLANLLLK